MKPVMKAAAVVALCIAVAPASADSARVEVRATVPASCNLQHGTATLVTFRPLLMRMPITGDCNTTHTVTVTYDPDVLSNPNLLVMALGATTPTSKAPGVVTFANLPYTNLTRTLRIGYAGPEVEREGIKNSVEIEVSLD